MKLLLLAHCSTLLLVILFANNGAAVTRFVCYFPSWTRYREGENYLVSLKVLFM